MSREEEAFGAEPNGEEEEDEPARKKFKRPSDQCKEVDATTGVRCDKFHHGAGGKCREHGGRHTCLEKGCPTIPTLGVYCDVHKDSGCKSNNPSAKCKEVDANTGVRCDKFKAHRGGKCGEHGGWNVCKEKDCSTIPTLGHYCDVHKPPYKYGRYPEGVTRGECKVPGCNNTTILPNGYCTTRHKDEEENALHYEWAQRLVRDRHLRDEWLDVLLAEQGGKCAQSVLTCEVVEDGQATSVCHWGDRPVRRDAAQVDHITPLWDGGTNNKSNLQVLCACCHATKTFAEARARAAARRLRQAT